MVKNFEQFLFIHGLVKLSLAAILFVILTEFLSYHAILSVLFTNQCKKVRYVIQHCVTKGIFVILHFVYLEYI